MFATDEGGVVDCNSGISQVNLEAPSRYAFAERAQRFFRTSIASVASRR
jgi:hypothetical protein